MVYMPSIRDKILWALLGTALGALLLIGVVGVVGFSQLRREMLAHSAYFGKLAALNSSADLGGVTLENLAEAARSRAVLLENEFAEVETQVGAAARVAAAIYAHPENYRPRPIDYLRPDQIGSVTTHLATASDTDFAAVREEAELLANLGDFLRAQYSGKADSDCYFGSESGFIIQLTTSPTDVPNLRNYDPRVRPWYQLAKKRGEFAWTKLFVDFNTGELALGCGMPVYRETAGGRELQGVVGCAFSISDNMRDTLNGLRVDNSGFAFVLDDGGRVILSSGDEVVAGTLLETEVFLRGGAARNELVRRMTRRETGSMEIVDDRGARLFVAYQPLRYLPWSLAVAVAVEKTLAPTRRLEEKILRLSDLEVAQIGQSARSLAVGAAAMMAVCAALTAGLALRLSRALTRPLAALCADASRIAAGDMDYRLAVNSDDEIGALAQKFNVMIDRVEAITAEQTRVGAELTMAANIQTRLLPRNFDDWQYASISASMRPAREVGGDFYDFFAIDEWRLAVVIADVSGKGMSAALFMVAAKILLKNHARTGEPLPEVFYRVNNQLCENNREEMFVTVFMGVLDGRTGQFLYVNGGHNPPAISRGGDFAWLPVKKSLLLGMMENVQYAVSETVLAPSDILFLYTDGVTEAMDKNDRLFGGERTLAALNGLKNSAPEARLPAMSAAIENFVAGAEQADDITMLFLQRRNKR
ncbi:hypothetical protein FACS1894139_12850 [Planctomycetales bacterium]|nr:hypothetical protein FACS1894107_05950 [Planctomycetales bacterium]GHT06608.1 hypothetical protein FACS1894139_12850 [Planctomycetales bacterium]